ncbi:MAG: type II toxin-antitoxin system RelE family toxin [Gammaproteobacteria bacterium]
MYTVKYHRRALKALAMIPATLARRFQTELLEIAKAPYTYQGDFKRLEGRSGWRLRIGGWRAICEIKENELLMHVLEIGTRGDVYK